MERLLRLLGLPMLLLYIFTITPRLHAEEVNHSSDKDTNIGKDGPLPIIQKWKEHNQRIEESQRKPSLAKRLKSN